MIFAAGGHAGGPLTEEAIRAAFKTTKSIVYMCVTFVAMVVLSIVAHRVNGKYIFVNMGLIALFGKIRNPRQREQGSVATHGRVAMLIPGPIHALWDSYPRRLPI